MKKRAASKPRKCLSNVQIAGSGVCFNIGYGRGYQGQFRNLPFLARITDSGGNGGAQRLPRASNLEYGKTQGRRIRGIQEDGP